MQIFMGGRGNGKTVEQTIVAISEGNPGCMQFCCELLSKGGYEALLMLTEAGLKGSRAYQLWNDCCGRDTEKAIKVLQYRKDGRITEEEMKDHVFQPWGKPFNLEEIEKRETAKPEGGFLKARYGMVLAGRTPEGTCLMCAVKHDPDQPHNLQSLAYQYKFYDEHGRWPTWKDAMEHCTKKVQQFWIQALKEKGVKIDG